MTRTPPDRADMTEPEALSPKEVEAQTAIRQMRYEILHLSDGVEVDKILEYVVNNTPEWNCVSLQSIPPFNTAAGTNFTSFCSRNKFYQLFN